MPSHITHHLFARSAIKGAVSKNEFQEIQKTLDPYISFGAQGPDIFLHNRKRSPSALKYGISLHKRGYATFCANLLRLQDNTDTGHLLNSTLIYTLAFISHGILDRYAHPFINYFSGWVVQGQTESLRYLRLHPFFERIIDVLLLEKIEHKKACEYDFFNSISLGKDIPAALLTLLTKGIESTYYEKEHVDLENRLKNAYWDAMDFYRFTNPIDVSMKQLAYKREKNGESTKRILALFHPCELPEEIDFLNKKRNSWRSPFPPHKERKDSFIDSYERALDEATSLIKDVVHARKEGRGFGDDVARSMGDENLSDGTKEGVSTASCSSPLPLEHILKTIYDTLENSIEKQ